MAYFTALPVPPHIATALQALTPVIPGATYTHINDFHLTLKYLSIPTPDVLETVTNQCASTPLTQPLPITLTHLHVFQKDDLHFLVALTENPPALHQLHLQQEAAATALGIAPYAFPSFIPHITLASYPPQTLEVSTHPLNLSFSANTFTLYQSSRSHGTGVGRYTPLQSFSLHP